MVHRKSIVGNLFLVVIILAGFMHKINGQDTIDKDDLENSLKYDYNYAIGSGIEVNTQFTATNLGVLFGEDAPPLPSLRLGVEQRFAKKYSIKLESALSTFSSFGTSLSYFEFLGQMRRFIHFEKKDQERINLNGTYIGLGYSLNSWLGSGPKLRLGYQSRFLNYGYFDLGFDLDFLSDDINVRSEFSDFEISFSPNVKFGFGYSQKYNVEMDDFKCSVLRCYENDRSMFKVNLLDLLSFNISQKLTGFRSRINIAYEHKLSEFGWSLNHDLTMDYQFLKSENHPIFYSTYSDNNEISYLLELRYYINKRKRVLQGKSGNNLNGFFMDLIGGSIYSATFNYQNDTHDNYSLTGGGAGIGYQLKILNRFYLEIKSNIFLGRKYDWAKPNTSVIEIEGRLIPKLNFGFAF